MLIKVRDRDRLGRDDPMGFCFIELDSLKSGVEVDKWVTLQVSRCALSASSRPPAMR